MQKNKLMQVAILIGSVLIIIGISLMLWSILTNDERNAIKISLDIGDSKPIKFEALSLIPGDECEYSVKLQRSRAERFDLSLDFVEIGDGALKDYARVKIIAKDDVVYDELLANTLENKRILFSVDFGEDKNTEFRIVYYLPLDVGNEVKNAEAQFELVLTASNE
jgi:hypothetical protein